ncbi:MAG: TIGR03086 family protein [Actinobacteria bacterium]|nr:TIGR03086 family protein [Actinomycetota bacterium]
MNQIADRYRRLSEHFIDLVERVPDDAWTSPSPCDGWTARDVVAHVVDVHGMMLKPLHRGLSDAPAVADDPAGAVRSATADVQRVLDDPESAGTEYDGYFGPTTVQATIDRFLGIDLVVHAWDLASAAGLDEQIAETELARVRADVEDLGDNMRAPNVVGPPLDPPADASEQDRLLAFLGRDPHWTPGTAKARA